jgi:hypothetical protein
LEWDSPKVVTRKILPIELILKIKDIKIFHCEEMENMNIPSHNEIILENVYNLYNEAQRNGDSKPFFFFNDQDESKYLLMYDLAKDKFIFSFYAKYYEDIFSIAGKEMLAEFFPGKIPPISEISQNSRSRPLNQATISLFLTNAARSLKLVVGKTIKSDDFLDKDDKERKAAVKQAEEEFFSVFPMKLALFKKCLFTSPYMKIFKSYLVGISSIC